MIFSTHRDSLSVASMSPPSRGRDGELQPWTLASSQAEGGPSHTERPTKKPRSEKAPDGNKEDMSAMIGSLDEIAARLGASVQAQSTHARPRRGLQTASEMARPVRLALRVLELYQGTRRWDASSVSQVFP